MKTPKENSRRQFLKNTSLAALSFGLLPVVAKAISKTPADNTKGAKACDETTNDYYGQGPFYSANAPTLQNNQLSSVAEPGTKLTISGRIFNLDCSEAVPNTVIDIWHADDSGDYDNTGFNLRGQVTTNSQGFYVFETIKPGKYLNGQSYRPSHIHFKITPPGFSTLTTQLYFSGDQDIPGDAAASITTGVYDARDRIIPLTNNGADLDGTWDIVIDGNGISLSLGDLHLDKGMLYKAGPNPFRDQIKIEYGVFTNSKVNLSVYNLEGKLVATLEEKTLQTQKYEAIWTPDSMLPNGNYFIALKVNDLQVHYLKVIKQS
tara:strand:+ start:12016 stop:12972 length:957 start_codon:yes stop_codon:yes gene_type:complete